MSSAGERISDIVEVLEQILLDVPIKDLLVNAHRVNKTWVAVIKGSTKLQQALFFEPVPIESCRYADRTHLAQAGHQQRGYSTVVVHHETHGTVSRRYLHDVWVTANPFESLFKKKRTEKTTRPEASWRRMFISQPPTIFSWRSTEFLKLDGLLDHIAADRGTLQRRDWTRIEYARDLLGGPRGPWFLGGVTSRGWQRV